MAEKTTFKDSLIRAVALIGLVLVLLLGAWGIILLAFNLSSIASSVGSSAAALLSIDQQPADDEVDTSTTTPVETPKQTTTSTKTTTTSASSATTASTPAATPQASYVAAPRPAQLYGSADLAVRIVSVNGAASAQAQSYVQFEVYNAGTNVAPAGWMFNASLPVGYTYTYSSPVQQALYPGDKIVYTLGFTRGYTYRDGSSSRYDECGTSGYRSWDESDWEEWYDNDCDHEYDCNSVDSDWRHWDDRDWKNWYEDECDENYYDDHYAYDNSYYTYNSSYNTGGTVSITVDPQGRIYDLNRYNNTASQALTSYYPVYQPTYPTYPQQYPFIY